MKVILVSIILSVMLLPLNKVEAQRKSKKAQEIMRRTMAADTVSSYTINGIGHQLSTFEKNDDYIKCGSNANSSSSYNTIIKFSCTRTDTNFVGSWTVRNVSPPEPHKNKPETVNIYFYDGIINFASLDLTSPTKRKYELKGTATYVAGNCRVTGSIGWVNQYSVTISGECGSNKIHFVLENEVTGETYATATFSSDVNVTGQLNDVSVAQTTLNKH
jgi:hypothetical protein